MCRATVYENGVDRYLLIKFEYLRMGDDSVETLYHSLELSSVFVSLRGRNLGLFTQDLHFNVNWGRNPQSLAFAVQDRLQTLASGNCRFICVLSVSSLPRTHPIDEPSSLALNTNLKLYWNLLSSITNYSILIQSRIFYFKYLEWGISYLNF